MNTYKHITQKLIVFCFLLFTAINGSSVHAMENIHGIAVDKSEKTTVSIAEDTVMQDISTPNDFRKRFGLASAVYTIKGEDIEDEFVTNTGRILSGKLPGLIVMQGSGEPGRDEPSFHVRGLSSFNSSVPKIYVDGFEAPMNHLDPREIETISLLKDAGALAQLGINGANGAIWITTKRGIAGAPKVKISLEQGMQEPVTLPKFANAYQYASLYNEALSNDRGQWTDYYAASQLEAYRKGNDGTMTNENLLYPNVNWYDEVLKSFAPVTNANISFTGGNHTVLYYLLLGYQQVDGLNRDTDKKRKTNSNVNSQKFNFRANIDARLNSIFSVKTSISGNIIDRFNPAYNVTNLWNNMMCYPANAFPVMTPKGYGGTSLYPDNPKATALEIGLRQYHDRNIQATVTLIQNLDVLVKGLNLSETVSVYNNQSQTYQKTKNYQRFAPFMENGSIEYHTTGTADTEFAITQRGNGYNSFANRINTELALGYDNHFGNHSLSASLIYHADKYNTPGIQVPLLMRGFDGRVNYNYQMRYLAEIGASCNGMSPYSPGKNIGTFPSLSLAWIASNESFLNNSTSVDYLKFRGSAGLTGMADLNTAANYFMYQQYYNSGSSTAFFGWDGTGRFATLYEYYIANPNASWEKSFMTNIGIDLQLFGKRLGLTTDFFYENRYDILTDANVFDYTGMLNDKNYNLGKVSNKGVEVNLNWNDRAGQFSYHINPAFAFARNKIIEMNEEPKAYRYQEQTGTRIGTYYGLMDDGLLSSWDEINGASCPRYMFAPVQPGDIRYVDRNNDGVIDNNDKMYLTDYYTNIPEINFGMRLGMDYKGIDLEIYGYGMANRTVSVRNILNSAFENGTGNLSIWALDRWAYYPDKSIDTRSNATYPRLSIGSNKNNWENNSTFWLRNGNFFRLSNVVLGYTIPGSASRKLHIDRIRVYFAANNLFTIDYLNIGDVESPTGYPLMRTYKMGLNINF